jgi:hypothetical protein
MKVILLNQDYSYINSNSVRRALKLIAKEKVTVEKYLDSIDAYDLLVKEGIY